MLLKNIPHCTEFWHNEVGTSNDFERQCDGITMNIIHDKHGRSVKLAPVPIVRVRKPLVIFASESVITDHIFSEAIDATAILSCGCVDIPLSEFVFYAPFLV